MRLLCFLRIHPPNINPCGHSSSVGIASLLNKSCEKTHLCRTLFIYLCAHVRFIFYSYAGNLFPNSWISMTAWFWHPHYVAHIWVVSFANNVFPLIILSSCSLLLYCIRFHPVCFLSSRAFSLADDHTISTSSQFSYWVRMLC